MRGVEAIDVQGDDAPAVAVEAIDGATLERARQEIAVRFANAFEDHPRHRQRHSSISRRSRRAGSSSEHAPFDLRHEGRGPRAAGAPGRKQSASAPAMHRQQRIRTRIRSSFHRRTISFVRRLPKPLLPSATTCTPSVRCTSFPYKALQARRARRNHPALDGARSSAPPHSPAVDFTKWRRRQNALTVLHRRRHAYC